MARAARHDPLNRLLAWLQSHELLAADELARWEQEADHDVRAAIEVAEQTPPPSAESVTEDVYAVRSYAPSSPGG
jgi:TPP-dependent pyruvate/acetoin dehydrogenase alpha subunit